MSLTIRVWQWAGLAAVVAAAALSVTRGVDSYLNAVVVARRLEETPK